MFVHIIERLLFEFSNIRCIRFIIRSKIQIKDLGKKRYLLLISYIEKNQQLMGKN